MLQKASTKFFKSHPSFISVFIYYLCLTICPSFYLSVCLSIFLSIHQDSYFSIFLSLPHTIFLSMKEKNCVHLCGCSSPKTQHSRKHFHRSNVPSKLRAHGFSTSAHRIFLLAYNKYRSRMLLLPRQANARTAK